MQCPTSELRCVCPKLSSRNYITWPFGMYTGCIMRSIWGDDCLTWPFRMYTSWLHKWRRVKLCVFEVKGWKEDDVEVEGWNGGVSDWDGKVAWAEEGGAGVQGVWQWGSRGCVPLTTAVLCMGSPQTASSGSHGWSKGRLLSRVMHVDKTALILLLACMNYYHTLSSLTLCGQLGSVNLSVYYTC